MKLKKILKESDLTEDKDTRVGMIINSHLSDVQNHVNSDLQKQINFGKFLLDKYLASREYIDADTEYAEFEQKYKR